MTTSPHHDGNGTTGGGENATLLGESEGATPMEYNSYGEVNSVALLYTLNRSLHQGRANERVPSLFTVTITGEMERK